MASGYRIGQGRSRDLQVNGKPFHRGIEGGEQRMTAKSQVRYVRISLGSA